MTTDDERSSVERREVEDRFEMPLGDNDPTAHYCYRNCGRKGVGNDDVGNVVCADALAHGWCVPPEVGAEASRLRRDLTACRSELASIALLLQERMMLPDPGGDNFALVAGAVTRYVLRLEDEYTWEQGQRRALMDNLRSLWVAFGRDPDDEASYVTEHGVGNVVVNDFAVAIRAMRARIEELEAASEALNEDRKELAFLRTEEVDDLRRTVVMLWDLMPLDQCIQFSGLSPIRYNAVQHLWNEWNERRLAGGHTELSIVDNCDLDCDNEHHAPMCPRWDGHAEANGSEPA